jgi:hypothetical protein
VIRRFAFRRPTSRFGLMSVYGLFALFGLLVARFIPVARIFSPWWGCPLRRTTGVPCMACGLTRAFDWEAHGHFLRAFKLTPLGAIAPVAAAALAAYGLAVIAVRAPVPDIELDATGSRVLRWSIIGLVLANWVYMVATRTAA